MRPLDRPVSGPELAPGLPPAVVPYGPAVIELPMQSAPAQYTAPGTRNASGSELDSLVPARYAAVVEHGSFAAVAIGEQSSGPPAS